MFIVDHDWLKKRPKGHKSWTGNRGAPSLYGLSVKGDRSRTRKAPRSDVGDTQRRQELYTSTIDAATVCLQSNENEAVKDDPESKYQHSVGATVNHISVPAAPGFDVIKGLEGYLSYYLDVISTSQHPLEVCFRSRSNALRSFWFPLAFRDDLWLQSVVLSSAAHHSLEADKPWPVQAQLLLPSFLSQLNTRISGGTLNDGTIATISCLLLIEHDSGRSETAKAHANGLSEIVKLRGGLEHVQRERRAKLVRADIVRAVDDLVRPSLPRLPEEGPYSAQKDTSYTLASFPHLGISNEIWSVFRTLRRLCQDLDLRWSQTTLSDPMLFYEEVFRCCYDLLMFDPLNDLDEVMRLSLLVFMLPLYRQRPFSGAGRSKLLTKLTLYLSITNIAVLNPELRLWLLFIGSISVQKSHMHASAVLQLREALDRTGLLTNGAWAQVKSHLQHYLWTDVIHNSLGESCYDALTMKYDDRSNNTVHRANINPVDI